MAYVLKYPAGKVPGTDEPFPAGEWLIDGDSLPLNVKGNAPHEDLPVHNQDKQPHLARAHIDDLREAWELRQKATAKVAG